MYPINDDIAVKLEGIPQPSVGSPAPVIIGDEQTLLLAYNARYPEPTVRPGDVKLSSVSEYVAIVDFRLYQHYSFGWPNDEALSGHPLYERGLESYAAFEVKGSSWIKELEKRNAVHPSHDPNAFQSLHHYVFTFHDSTFECVARGYEITEERGSISALLPAMLSRLAR